MVTVSAGWSSDVEQVVDEDRMVGRQRAAQGPVVGIAVDGDHAVAADHREESAEQRGGGRLPHTALGRYDRDRHTARQPRSGDQVGKPGAVIAEPPGLTGTVEGARRAGDRQPVRAGGSARVARRRRLVPVGRDHRLAHRSQPLRQLGHAGERHRCLCRRGRRRLRHLTRLLGPHLGRRQPRALGFAATGGEVVQGQDVSLLDAGLFEGEVARQQMTVAAHDPLGGLVHTRDAADLEEMWHQPCDRDVPGQCHLTAPGFALDGDEESL